MGIEKLKSFIENSPYNDYIAFLSYFPDCPSFCGCARLNKNILINLLNVWVSPKESLCYVNNICGIEYTTKSIQEIADFKDNASITSNNEYLFVEVIGIGFRNAYIKSGCCIEIINKIRNVSEMKNKTDKIQGLYLFTPGELINRFWQGYD